MDLVEQEGSLAVYAWGFEPAPSSRPALLTASVLRELTESPESRALARDLRRRGWSYLGPTTVYAFMQAVGLVNDHLDGCELRPPVQEAREALARLR